MALSPKPRTKTANDTRPRTWRFRSVVDSESLDDLAPVLCVSPRGSGGEKSKLGSMDGGGVDVEVVVAVVALGSEFWDESGGGGGGLEAIYRTERATALRARGRPRTANIVSL
jgi:hypothetical protein